MHPARNEDLDLRSGKRALSHAKFGARKRGRPQSRRVAEFTFESYVLPKKVANLHEGLARAMLPWHLPIKLTAQQFSTSEAIRSGHDIPSVSGALTRESSKRHQRRPGRTGFPACPL